MSIRRGMGKSRGVTLVELIVFMVIIGVAMAGIFAAFNTITTGSADPQLRKQMLAIAESLMEEIQLKPFTCTSGCAGSRPFDSVKDYNGFGMTGIKDITGADVAGLESYSAAVAVDEATATLGSGGNTVGAGSVALITVTVTRSGMPNVVLHGYRTNYAPETNP